MPERDWKGLGPPMTGELEARLQALEEQLEAEPSSQAARQEILYAFGASGMLGDPRRLPHVIAYVRRFPGTELARSPFVYVDGGEFPQAFAAVEEVWAELQRQQPDDPDIARGFAAFVAGPARPRAMALLDQALRAHPRHAGLWLDKGRLATEPQGRLRAFQTARELGASHPNLLTFIVRAAIEARDAVAVRLAADELLSLAERARATHGDRLDWTERGNELWQRARAATDGDSQARRLVAAIADHANHKHWAHTALGVLAAWVDDLAAARHHLAASADVTGDYRLAAYGPSFALARELCARGQWDEVKQYLRACERFWDAEILRAWQDELDRRRTPAFSGE